MTRSPISSRWCVAWLALLVAGAAATADVSGIRPSTIRPVMVRGGVLLLPVAPGRAGAGWPDRLELVFRSGDRVEALVVRTPARPPIAPGWTTSPGGLVVAPVAPGADANEGGTGSFLLAELPPGAVGDFSLDLPASAEDAARAAGARLANPATLIDESFVVRPVWVDAPPPANPEAPALPVEPGPGRPDPDSPFEWWRWMLLARRLGVSPPDLPPGELDRLVARHVGEYWSVGIERLASQSPGVAAECVERLTQTCRDGELEIATWVCDPVEVATLLNYLLDFNRSDLAVMESAFAWARSRPPEIAWVESSSGGEVVIAVANPSVADQVASAQWSINGLAAGDPVDVTLPPGAVERVRLRRPREVPGDPIGRQQWFRQPMTLTLRIEDRTGPRGMTLTLPPAVVPAQPPGVSLPPLHPTLTLLDARRGAVPIAVTSAPTGAALRRVSGRWELYAECRLAPGVGPAPVGVRPPAVDGAEIDGPVPDDSDSAPEHDESQLESPTDAPSPGADAIGSLSSGAAVPDPAPTAPPTPAVDPSAELAVEGGEESTNTASGRSGETAPRPRDSIPGVSPSTLAAFDPLPVGRDALTVIIGPPGAPRHVLCVPAIGEAWMPVDEGGSGGLAVRRRLVGDVWKVRLTLPESWIDEGGATLQIALVRTHADSPAIEVTGPAPVPWSPMPAPTDVDLSTWDGFVSTRPRTPGQRQMVPGSIGEADGDDGRRR